MAKDKEHASPKHSEHHQHKSAKHTTFPDKYYQDPLGLDRYVVQEKILFTWRAPNKISRKRSHAEKTQLMLIAVFCLVVLLLLTEIWVALVFSVLVGLYIVLMTAQPTYIDCQITTLGVKVGDKYYFWGDLSQFWIEDRADSRVLYIRVIFPAVQIVRLVIYPQDEDELKTTMATYLLYKQPTFSTWEKAWRSATEKLPIDLEFIQL
jgi:hypothetical protein